VNFVDLAVHVMSGMEYSVDDLMFDGHHFCGKIDIGGDGQLQFIFLG
jgi:hypothetical protein